MRALLGEAIGTALLLYIVVGSGIAAESLSSDQAIRLFAHSVAVGLGLGAIIATFQTVSGAHFNPSVTLALWRTGDIAGDGALRYVGSQLVGAVVGVAAANLSFQQAVFSVSDTARDGSGKALAEGIATFVLVFLILALVQTGRSSAVPAAVGAWVAAIVFATASTGFANPAVTISRILTDTYTGIGPSSVPAFLIAQIVGGWTAAVAARYFFPIPVRQPATK